MKYRPSLSHFLTRVLPVCSALLVPALWAQDTATTAPIPIVAVEATGKLTSEPIPAAIVKPGEFTIRRKGSLDTALTVYLAYGGTASAEDYEKLPESVTIPVGADSTSVLVLAKADDLIEGTESVYAKIISPAAGPDAPGAPYEIAPSDTVAEVRIADEDKGSDLPTVGVKVVREQTIEPSPLSRIAPGEFVVYRDNVTEALTVNVAFEGSATPGEDYQALENTVQFAPGESEVRVFVAPVDDSLPESDETVALLLTASSLAVLPKYNIDPNASAAKLVIHDNDTEPGATIKITRPEFGAEFPAGKDVEISAVAVDPKDYIPTLEFYVDGELFDTSVINFIRAPDPGTPIYHQGLWKSATPGKHQLVARGKDSRGVMVSSEPIVIVVGEGFATEDVYVSIRATDPEGTELPLAFSSIDPLQFEISRTGPTNGSLIVFFSLHGTASKEDYFDVPTSIIIPAGSASATLEIAPRADLTKMLEPMETVGVRLEPAPTMGPLRTYGIDLGQSWAAGVIYEQNRPAAPAVELAFPDAEQSYAAGENIELVAAAYYPELTLQVEFFDGETNLAAVPRSLEAFAPKLPGLSVQSFTWKGAAPGQHRVTARMKLPNGEVAVSQTVLVTVKGSVSSDAYIKIAEPGNGQVFAPGDAVKIEAIAVDLAGYISHVDFFANEEKIGESNIAFFRAPDPGTPITHDFVWENVAAGTYVISARAISSSGAKVECWPVKIVVGRALPNTSKLEVTSPAPGAVFEVGAELPVTAVAVDQDGYISRVEFYANDALIGVSEVVFVRAPDPGTPITHSTVWGNVPEGSYAITARAVNSKGTTVSSDAVQVTVGKGGGEGGTGQVVLMVEAVDQLAAETTDTGEPDQGVFVIRRIAGRKDVEVPVSIRLSGTASNGSDYTEIKEQVILPAGSDSVEVVVTPIPDKAIDPDETVELSLISPICPLIFPPPPQCYLIAKSGSARVLIRELSSASDDWQTKVAIVPPNAGAGTSRSVSFEIRADAAVKGKPCVLETSVDLKTWSAVSPVVLPDGQLTYVTEPGSENQRFYRLRVQ